MPKTIKAPKTNNKDLNIQGNKQKVGNLNQPKTYKTKSKQSSPAKLFFIIILNIFIILTILFAIITYIQGYVYIPKLLDMKTNEFNIPNKINKKTLEIKDSKLSKLQQLDIKVNNSLNTQNYILDKNNNIKISLAEGINTLNLQKILNLKIIKFGGTTKTITVTVDTTPPHLLTKPKVTNQGLVLEFTEPTILKIINPFHKTFKTDDSYTIIIPLNLIKNSNVLKLEFIDNLGNSRQIELILNKKQINTKQTNNYNKKELPKSAGLIENINIIGAITLFIILSIPSLFIISATKIKQYKEQQ